MQQFKRLIRQLFSWYLFLVASLVLASADLKSKALPVAQTTVLSEPEAATAAAQPGLTDSVSVAAQANLNSATASDHNHNLVTAKVTETASALSDPKLAQTAEPAAAFKLGLENISAELSAQLKPLRLALITNQTGVTQSNQRNIDYLLAQGYQIVRIYVPEHGLTGQILAEKTVHDTVDQKTKIPVISLYGGDSAFKKPTKQDLAPIDALVFDIQDAGMRHYTYISILLRMLQVAAEFQKQFVILDRPNPLGIVMEGPSVDPGLTSFISIAPIPLRHALTVGELAQYFNAKLISASQLTGKSGAPLQERSAVNLVVVPMANYTRDLGLAGQLLQPLSPNLASIQSLYGYSFLGLLGELNPVDVAVKTPAAFQAIGLPVRQAPSAAIWAELQALLAKHHISTTPYNYANAAGDWKFQGLKLQIVDINQVTGFPALLDCAQFFRDRVGLKFKYGPSFDKAIGTKRFKQWVAGELALADWQAQIKQDLQTFAAQVTPYLLYTPAPKVVN